MTIGDDSVTRNVYKEDRVIRLGFGSTPGKVIVRLGKHSNLTYNATPARPTRTVSCIWDTRLKVRPRRLKLATRKAELLTPRMSSYHGRYLYA